MSYEEIKCFVFTDIVASTRLKAQMPGGNNAERDAQFTEQILRPHRAHIEQDLERFGGRIISTQGDGHFLVFRSPINATLWAIEVQRRHESEAILAPGGENVGVKIGVHMGQASVDPNDPQNFIGRSVDYAARLVDFGAAGQVLASRAVSSIVENEEIAGIELFNHGARDLRGIGLKPVIEVLYDGKKPSPLKGEQEVSNTRPTQFSPTDTIRTPSRSAAGGTQLEAREGTRLGKYELKKKIASGGMGSVFLARHTGMGRDCVVKLIRDSLLEPGNEEVINRFYREIKLLARIDHPNVVGAYDSSSQNDSLHYLVMEHVDGVSLDEVLVKLEHLRAANACEVIRQAATGLQYIHEQGMVHRDVKPSNLILTCENQQATVKILDLGLALLIDESEGRITEIEERAMGTGFYMAPEQWESTSVDIRADIYGLGCTFYHLLAGRPPFYGSKYTQKYAHQSVAPPELSAEELGDATLWPVLQKMLAKSPEERYSQPAEVAQALAAVAGGSDLPGLYFEAESITDPAPSGKITTTSRGPHEETAVNQAGESREATEASGASSSDATSQPHTTVTKPGWMRPVALAVLVLLVLGGVAAVLLPLIRGEQAPPGVKAQLSQELGTMPGMNGDWWFNELPWLTPGLRAELMHQAESQTLPLPPAEYAALLESLRGDDIDGLYEQLNGLAEELVAELPDRQRAATLRLLRTDPGELDEDDLERELGDIAASLAESQSPTELHLRAVLLHRLADFNEAQAAYEQALAAYESSEERNPELLALCRADYALLLYDLKNYGASLPWFYDARDPVDSPAFWISCLISEAQSHRRMGQPTRSDDPLNDAVAIIQQSDDSELAAYEPPLSQYHPLGAAILEARAWAALERWRLDDATNLFDRANETRRHNLESGNRRSERYILLNLQGSAMAEHFLGQPIKAIQVYEDLLRRIEASRASNALTEKQKHELRDRRTNIYDRLSDCYLFGDNPQYDEACQAMRLGLEAADDGRFDADGRWPNVQRLRYKLVIALVLAGRLEEAQLVYEECEAFEAEKTTEQGEITSGQLGVYEDAKTVAGAFLQLEGDETTRELAAEELREYVAGARPSDVSRRNIELILLAAEQLMAADALDAQELDRVSRRLVAIASDIVGRSGGRDDNSPNGAQGVRQFFRRYLQAAANSLDRALTDPELSGQLRTTLGTRREQIETLLEPAQASGPKPQENGSSEAIERTLEETAP